MQQAQQRENPDRISWARAMIFGVGFFFIAAILIGQLPGFIYNEMTAASLQGFEQGIIALAVACLAGFAVIQVIVLLFDPKPVVPPAIISGVGAILAIGGTALTIWASYTSYHYFPVPNGYWNPILGGTVLWFQPNCLDLVMVGLAVLFVGMAMLFYGVLAIGEQRNPDRSDRGATPAVRAMLIASIMLLIIFMVAYTAVNDNGLAYKIDSANGAQIQVIIDTVINCVLGLALFLALGSFALRLHYLMRPVRKRTMAPLYAFGALGLAQLGAILLVLWFVMFPLIAWMHSWTFIGLGDYFTVCAK